tara:strand:+ start:171 stop:329 length:159 start_codon:yes stop_codon:yes gene_type:complete
MFFSSLLAVAFAGSELVASVPNYKGGPLCFKHYSGYLPVAAGAKNLFHWCVW